MFRTLIFLLLAGCTQHGITNENVSGTWYNKNGSYIRINTDSKLVGYHIPRHLIYGLEPKKASVVDFKCKYEIDNKDHKLRMYLGSYSCPLYIRRNGFFESEDISYLYLLEDVDTDERYVFHKAKNFK